MANKLDKFSDAEILKILNGSTSYEGFLKSCGYSSGRSFHVREVGRKRLEKMGINYKDYLWGMRNKRTFKSKTPDEDFYTKGTFRGSYLSRRIRKDEKIQYICDLCSNDGNWLGQKLTLQVDHIDGDNTNNEVNNLRWLCPNCHSQTINFRNKKQ